MFDSLQKKFKIVSIALILVKSLARVAELAYALDLGSSPERDRGSTPLSRTII